uniref:Uncharacterized protein n=1 Tax=Siphoviridae sp. ctTnV63 TaxID=2825523 RepID=A0A8S5NV48_9CAUD|nr:MAG TPA: hypothetical protein [Siphoviridae sp. ctTnV63]
MGSDLPPRKELITMEKMTQTKALAYVLETYAETLPKDVAERLIATKATLEKKQASGKSEKDTPENQARISAILSFMQEGKKYLVSDILKSVPELDGLSTPKGSSLMKWLTEDGSTAKIIEKGRSYYTVVKKGE